MPVFVVHYSARFFSDTLILKEVINDTRSVPAFLISGLTMMVKDCQGNYLPEFKFLDAASAVDNSYHLVFVIVPSHYLSSYYQSTELTVHKSIIAQKPPHMLVPLTSGLTKC